MAMATRTAPTKTMVMAFNSGNPLAVYFLFGAFLMVTAGVLLGMDVLGTLPQFAVDYPRHEFQFKTRVSTRPSSRR